MSKKSKKTEQISYLDLFRKSLALSFSVFLFGAGAQESYAESTITAGDTYYQTAVNKTGNTYNITGGRLRNSTYFHNFKDFKLGEGDIANLIFANNYNRYINLVDNQIVINGIFNSISNGAVGGNVVFISPGGLIVGSSGIMNVGSLQLITPNSTDYNKTVRYRSSINEDKIKVLKSDSKTSNTQILGKVFSQGAIDIADGKNITIGRNSDIVSGFNADGFAKTRTGDISGIVNTDGLVDSAYLTGNNGSIKLVAKEIGTEMPLKSGLIQSTGAVTLDTPGSASSKITTWGKIKAGGDVLIGKINPDKPTESTANVNINNEINSAGNITVNGDVVNINEGSGLTSNKTVSVNASTDTIISENITGSTGVDIHAKANVVHSANKVIKNTGTGNIAIDTVNYKQSEGSILRNEGSGNITIDAPGINNILYNIEAQDGYVDIKTRNLLINDTIKAADDVNISATTIDQKSGNFTAIKSGGNVKLTASSAIGSTEQTLNLDSAGTVSLIGSKDALVDANIKGVGENDLNLKEASLLNNINVESANAINVSGVIQTTKDINLTAAKGINQEELTSLSTYGGNVILQNSGSGNITTANITSEVGTVTINNSGSGDVALNGNINSYKSATVQSEGNVEIGGIVKSSAGNIQVTAKKDITQTPRGVSLDSAGEIVVSTEGNVGSDAQRLNVKTQNSGTVLASAGKSVHINGFDTDIDLANITAGTDIDLATSGTGNLIVGGAVKNENGDIKLKSDKLLNVENDIIAKGDVRLQSSSGIIQNAGTLIESGAFEGGNGNADFINNGEGGITLTNVTAHGGNIIVFNSETSSGDVVTGSLTATEGIMAVHNRAVDGSVLIDKLLTSGENTEITAKKDILQTSNQELAIKSGGTVSLTAESGVVGDEKFLSLNAKDAVSVSAGSDINISSPGEDLKLGSVASNLGNVTLKTVDNASGTNKNIILTDTVDGNNVNITAAGSILQDTKVPTAKSITAKNNLLLKAQTGNIGEVTDEGVKAIGFSKADKGEFSAIAKSGSVAINGVKTDIDTSTVDAANNLYIKTTDSGNITVSNEQNVTGKIELDSADNIHLNKKVAATSDVTLSAQNDVIQDESLTGTALASGNNITITAKNAGTKDRNLIVDATNSLNIGTEDRYAGTLYVEDNTGDLTIGQIYSDNSINLKAQGNIVQADSSKTAITSTGNITLDSTSGNIGASGENSALKLNITGSKASFNVTNAKNVYVQSTEGRLNTGNITAANDVNISTLNSGDINLKGLIKGNNITLNAVDSIVQSKDFEAKTIDAAGDLTLISQQGDVGAEGSSGNAILFGIGDGALRAEAEQGSVYLNGVDIDINTGSIKAKNDIDLTTTNSGNITVLESLNTEGHIKLHSAEGVVMNNNPNLNAGDFIDIKTNGGDVVLNSILTAGSDITIDANGSIKQSAENNSVVLNAGKDINLIADGTIGEQSKNLAIKADGTVSAKSGKGKTPVPGGVYLTSADNSIKTGIIDANGNVKINATGEAKDITLNNKITANNVELNATGSIIQDLKDSSIDRSIEASGDMTFIAQSGNIGQTGNAIDFSSGGALTASAAQGSVVLNGIETDINTNSITALKDIDLSTQNSGKITVSNAINTQDGYIRLSSAEDLQLNHKLTAGKYVTLDSQGGISQAEGVGIMAGTNASTQVGEGNITITNSKGGNVDIKTASTEKGDITIKNKSAESGTVSVGMLSADKGSVSVTNEGDNQGVSVNSITAQNDISISASGSIKQNDTNTGLILNAGKNITLDSEKGDIAQAGKALKLNAGESVEVKANNVYLESPNKTLKISGINKSKATANGDIDLKTSGSGDIALNGLVKGANIDLQAANSISQKEGLAKAIDATSDLSITAQNGSIGSQGAALGFSAGGDLSASASQAVVLNGIDTNITTNSITAGTDIDIKTTIANDSSKGNIVVSNSINTSNGYVSLSSAKGLDISKNISASKNVNLSANNGDLQIASDITGTYLEMNANGNLTQSGGKLLSKGSNNGVGINAKSSSGNIVLNNAESQNGAINIEALNTSSSSGKVTAGNITAKGGKVLVSNSSSQDVVISGLLKSDDNVVVSSGGNITQSIEGSSINASKNVILNAVSDVGSNSQYIYAEADGTVSANGKNVYLGSKTKDLKIAGVSANSAPTPENSGVVKISTDSGNVEIQGLINGKNVSIDSAKGISQNSALDKAVNATELNLTANNGSIGVEGNALDVAISGDVSASSSSNIYLHSDNALNTGLVSATGIADISSDDELNLNNLLSAHDVNLKAQNNITQNSELQKSINAVNLNLTSTDGNIGTPQIGDKSANAIDFSATGTLSASASNGSIVLNGVNTSINTDSVVAGQNIDLSTTGAGSNLNVSSNLEAGGYIHLNSAEGLSIEQKLSALQFVSLEAQKDITLDADITGTYLEMNANGNLTQLSGKLLSTASDEGIGINAKSSSGNIILNNAESQNGAINIEALTTSSSSGKVTAGNISAKGGKVLVSNSSSQDVVISGLLKSDDNVEISSKGNITQSIEGSSINASKNVILNAVSDVGSNSQYIYAEADGTVSANGKNVYLGSKTKDLKIAGVSANSVPTPENSGVVKIKTDSGNVEIQGLIDGKNVSIDSAKGISQNSALDKAVNARETLVLTAQNGDIGNAAQGEIAANAIDFTAKSVEAHANKGSVVLNSTDFDLNTSSITALNSIDLTTTNSGDIVLNADLQAANGYVNLNSADNLLVNKSVTAENGSVSLISQNGNISVDSTVMSGADIDVNSKHNTILGAEVVANGDISVTAKNIVQNSDDITLIANNINLSTTENIGSTAKNLLVSANDLNVLTASNAYIANPEGDLTIGSINVTNDVNLSSKENIVQSVTGAGISSGNEITLLSDTADIGSPSSAVKINSGKVNATAENGNVYLTSTQNLNVGNVTAKETTNITADKGIELNGLITTNSADITAQNDISQGFDGKSIQATGGNINLTSNSGNIGTPNGNAIGFSVQNGGLINADAQNSGSVVLKGIDSDINTSSIKAKNDIDLTTTGSGNITVSENLNAGGYIKLDSANALSLDKTLTAEGNVELYAQNGDITLGAGVNAGNDIKVDASQYIKQTYDGTALNAANDINLKAGKDIGALATPIMVKTGSEGEISASGINIYINNAENDLNTGLMTATGTLNLAATNGSVNINKAINSGDLDISANNHISINNNITSTGEAVIYAEKGITQAQNTSVNTKNDLNISTNSGDLKLQDISSVNGAIWVENSTEEAGGISIHNISAAKDINIHNYGDGLIDINGKLTNNGTESKITAHNSGENSGIAISGNITNNGSLEIESNGQKGISISGNIDNSAPTNGLLSVTNNAGNLDITSNSIINNPNNVLTLTNNGDDFNINANMTAKGSEISVINNGDGNLVLGENAKITVYSVIDNGNIYTGTLNVENNGNSGDIRIDGQISGLADMPVGYITINNNVEGDSSIVLGNNATINAINNAINILNAGAGGIEINSGAKVNTNDKLTVSNTGADGITIDGTLKGKDIEISTKNSDILVAHNKAEGNVIASNSLTVKAENGNIFNSSTSAANVNNNGLVSSGNMEISAQNGSIGELDNTLNNIVQNGFVLDDNKSIHVSVGGTLDANADYDLNIKTMNKDLNIGTLSAKDALISAVNASINAGTTTSDNLYILAKGDNASINIDNLTNTGKLSTESGANTTIKSNSELNIDSMLSRKGSINIHSEGNTTINEISAPNDITIVVEDEKLSINNLGRVEREPSITPKTVNLTVKDAKNPPSNPPYHEGMTLEELENVHPNGKLDIYNAYVEEKLAIKADTINAQVYDYSSDAAAGQKRVDSNGNEATGIHNANKNGNALVLDIQGANYKQDEVNPDPPNAYYVPDENDKRALSANITIGDSINGAPAAVEIDKLYSDYASVDTAGSNADYTDINIKSVIIKEEGVIRNGEYRIDIDNNGEGQTHPANKHYTDESDLVINNETSFNIRVNDEIHVNIKPAPPKPPVDPTDPTDPSEIEENDPNRVPNVPEGNKDDNNGNISANDEFADGENANDDSSNNNEKQVSNKDNSDDDSDDSENSKKPATIKDFDWEITAPDKTVLGASSQKSDAAIKKLLALSKKGILVETSSLSKLKKGDIVEVYLKKGNKSFKANAKINSIRGNRVVIIFTNPDKYVENTMLFWYMQLTR